MMKVIKSEEGELGRIGKNWRIGNRENWGGIMKS